MERLILSNYKKYNQNQVFKDLDHINLKQNANYSVWGIMHCIIVLLGSIVLHCV